MSITAMEVEAENGNVEIGNGGGAYYVNLRSITISSGGNNNENHESGHPASTQKSAGQQGNKPKPTQQPLEIRKCSECGGWGVGLVQSWGYCSHCARVRNLPQCQLLSMYQAVNDASSSKPRLNVKPLPGKGNKKNTKNRVHAADDELDSSSY